MTSRSQRSTWVFCGAGPNYPLARNSPSFWKGTTREGAIAGMIVGFVVTVVWVVAFKADFYDLYEMIPGFLAAFAAIWLVSKMTAVGSGRQRGAAEGSGP